MDRKQALVVNLIGGPCSGKSTIAAELFARLKKMGIRCELVTEYIKERIYEENKTIPLDQIAVFGMEHYSIWNKIEKVDVIVHDGSLINNCIYKHSILLHIHHHRQVFREKYLFHYQQEQFLHFEYR